MRELGARSSLPLAIKSGLKIALGSDIGEGDHAQEFTLIANGVSPADALIVGARNAADLIGASDRIGSIQPGRYADLAATPPSPLGDPGQFERVDLVLKGGAVYRQGGQPTPKGGGEQQPKEGAWVRLTLTETESLTGIR